MKEKIKERLKPRLKIAIFVLALVGWFMLVVIPLELAGFNLDNLENSIKTPAFTWGIKIFVVFVLVLLIRGQKGIDTVIKKYRWLETVLKIIFGVGIIGWVVGLVSLLF